MATDSILTQFKFTADQKQAATRRSRAIAVTAGAGSGKTRVLVGRYLHLLEQGHPLRSLVAITFTDKAAREMRTRIRTAIQQRLSEAPPTELWQAAFTELDAARIGTIHSLCAEILRAHPAEAALDPNFSVLEEGQSAAWQAQAIEAALGWAIAQLDTAVLITLFTERSLRDILTTLIAKRLDVDTAWQASTLIEDILTHWLADRLTAPWLDALDTLSETRSRKADDKLETARRAVLDRWQAVTAARSTADWEAVFNGLAQLRAATSTQGQKANWAEADLATARDAMKTLRDQYDAELAPLIGKAGTLSWALDQQLAAARLSLQALHNRVLHEYQQLKDESQALDFDDLEGRAAQLLTTQPAVRQRWQRDVQAVLVDEFQDTNARQRDMVYALADFAPTQPERSIATSKVDPGELFIVGDAKQCLPPGTLILTPGGYQPIEQITSGQEIVAATGNARTGAFPVARVYERHHSGPVLKIRTSRGVELSCTPEHVLFTRLVPDLHAYYVYLMRHIDKGYRIGLTRGYRTGERRITNGLDSRCRQEGGDAIWVLRRCSSRKEAQLYEQLYLAQYGLPGLCFKVKDYQSLDQDTIDLIFARLPTRERAAHLAHDVGIDLASPHYVPGIAKEAVTVVYFGGKGNSRYKTHRISFETRAQQTAQRLSDLGIRSAKPSKHYPERWRIGTERARMDEARAFAVRAAQQAQTQLIERYALTTDKRWEQTAAGQIFPGLQIPIIDDARILADEIIEVTREQYEGTVYDLEIPDVHNYIANGMIVHNSIYRFRGADVAVFRQVQADVQAADGFTVDLDLTFRAHQALVQTLNDLLRPVLGESIDPARPYEVPFAELRAQRKQPEKQAVRAPFVEFHLGVGEKAEDGREAAAAALAQRLHTLHREEDFAWSDMALLFRATSGFGVYEDALERAGIPFITIAGRGFYDRPEIRDVLNALAAIHDPTDDLTLAGLLRSPAIGLSDADLYRLRFTDDDQPHSLWESLKTLEIFEDLKGLISELHDLAGRVSVAEVLKRFLDLTHYRTLLSAVPQGHRLRRNLDKLLADAHASRLISLGEFLEYVQTLEDSGVREGEASADPSTGSGGGAVQLMTVHKAKGLEFPVVVIADAAHDLPHRSSAVLLDDQLGLRVDLADADGAHPISYRLARLNEQAKDEAEDKRLLYVAATRAKEKLVISGHAKLNAKGTLALRGWLGRLGEVIGLDAITIDHELTAPLTVDLNQPIGCVLHPATDLPARPIALEIEPPPINITSSTLVQPLPIINQQSEIYNQQSRVWRVVPRVKRPVGPAWVIGQLTHEALRRWRFPDQANFDVFLWPFALEAGLTDRAEIQATLNEVRRMLQRFQTHPLYAEIDQADRRHEVPYALPDDTGVIDLIYRPAGGDWTIVDFKTDEVRSIEEMRDTLEREKYAEQVQRYIDAITSQIGHRPRGQLIFLRVGSTVQIEEL